MTYPKLFLLLPTFLMVACSDQNPPAEIALFNGSDIDNWTINLREDVDGVWTVKEGNLVNLGNPWGFIATRESYDNYKLELDWRWIPDMPITAKRANSGVFLHIQGDTPQGAWPKCFEAQLASGLAGAVIHMESTSSKELEAKLAEGGSGIGVARMDGVTENPPGEWNHYEIICQDDTIILRINGVLANRVTAISQQGGRIGLQSEGAAIEYRNVLLQPLD